MDESGYIGQGDNSYHYRNKYRGGGGGGANFGGGYQSWRGGNGRGYNPQYKNAQKWNQNSRQPKGSENWPTGSTSMYQKSAFGKTGKAQWRNGEDHSRPR